MLGLCTHAQNKYFLGGIKKTLLGIDGLLLFYQLIYLRFKNNTNEMNFG
jgi:hypothetical protein